MDETGRKGSREITQREDTNGEARDSDAHLDHRPGEEDVVAMLKKYGGDMDAATNALIDSESRARNIANPRSPARFRPP